MKHVKRFMTLLIALGLVATTAGAQVIIDNDLATTDIGFWEVRVLGGGESRSAWLTAVGTPSGTTFVRTEIIFDLFSYVDVGSGGFQLSSVVTSGPTLTNPDEVTSSGTFTGSAGNTIAFTVTSSIPDGSVTLTTSYEFTALTGTIGHLVLYQYLDEDVLSPFDDVFFTRGSVAGGDLELFTVDDDEAIGISHGGALNTSQGLNNAIFLGWAACNL